eukprot:5903823-Amphidinium_carterae.2
MPRPHSDQLAFGKGIGASKVSMCILSVSCRLSFTPLCSKATIVDVKGYSHHVPGQQTLRRHV